MPKVDLVRERTDEPRALKEIVLPGPTPTDPILVIRVDFDANVSIYVSDDEGETIVVSGLERAHVGWLMDGLRELMGQL